MNASQALQLIARERQFRSQGVVENPSLYKICEGCSSLVPHQSVFCPFCKAYRFNHEAAAIVQMAQLLGNRPLAFGCGVLPRFNRANKPDWV